MSSALNVNSCLQRNDVSKALCKRVDKSMRMLKFACGPYFVPNFELKNKKDETCIRDNMKKRTEDLLSALFESRTYVLVVRVTSWG